MLRNVFIREQTGLPSFCYADGKRSAAPPQRRIDMRLDSGIRAIAIELDLSYEEARRFVELEISAEKTENHGVPRQWMTKFFEYTGYVKAPQPTAALSLRQVLGMLNANHRVILEVDHSTYIPLIDGVLYDLEDWRTNLQRKVTGYWIYRQSRPVLPGTLKGRVVDSSGCVVDEFEDSDVFVRDPVELAGYAFYTRKFDNAWELDESGDATFEATFAVTLEHSKDPLTVQSRSLRCSPMYLRSLTPESATGPADSAARHRLTERTMTDARRLLDACDLEYELKGNGTLRLGRALGYRPRTGEVFLAHERKVKYTRGFKALLRTL